MPETTSEVTLAVQLLAQKGSEEELARALQASAEPTRAEEGCRLYHLHRSASDPRQFFVYERWASEDAIEDHEDTDHMRALQEAFDRLLEEHSMERYERIAE